MHPIIPVALGATCLIFGSYNMAHKWRGDMSPGVGFAAGCFYAAVGPFMALVGGCLVLYALWVYLFGTPPPQGWWGVWV